MASCSRSANIRGTSSSTTDEEVPLQAKKVLARKLTCAVLLAVFVGWCLILLIQVTLTLTAVPDWGADAKQAMIDLEQEHIMKLASDKAKYVTEIFGRVKEGLLQVQAFAGQALAAAPETIVVEQYVMVYSGLKQDETTWDHSVWFVSELGLEEDPEADSALEGLLNRSSLMDVPFRGMQEQHALVYLASLEDPSPAGGTVSDINMQSYAGFDMLTAGYLGTPTAACDTRAVEFDEGNTPTVFDPRCRPWYRGAVEVNNTGVFFTNPYADAGSEELIVSVAAPVYDISNTTLLLGVVGIDMDFTEIEHSIKDLNVVGNEGYAYLLAPGGEGEVAVHKDLVTDKGTQYITNLESGVDADEFGAIAMMMSESCDGFETYSKDGSAWLLSWRHETASDSNADGVDNCGDGGFIAVVTVDEATLLEAFSKLESEVPNVVAWASAIMALVVLAIACVTGCTARAVSTRVTRPVEQLAAVVHALNNMDFSRQGAGTWIVNDNSCPELEELIKAFESMATVVKFANVSLEGGDIELAKKNYVKALILFKKLGNDRGVGIVNNNLGNVYTLQARALSDKADGAKSNAQRANIMEQAQLLYSDAETNYRLAIEDARMLCAATGQRGEGSSPLPKSAHPRLDSNDWNGGDSKSEERTSVADVESGGANENDLRADDAVFLQLANREFNLALCLAAKASGNVARGEGTPDPTAMQEVRELILDCVQVTVDAKDPKSSQRQVEFLLELAAIERSQKGGQRAAAEAIHVAERVVDDYSSQVDAGYDASGTLATTPPQGVSPPAPVSVLRQQLLAARGALCIAEGNPIMAIRYWTSAILDCGGRMDVRAVVSSLEGLRSLALSGNHGGHFPPELLVGLNLPQGGDKDSDSLTYAIKSALTRVQRLEVSAGVEATISGRYTGKKYWTTTVDLCFVMDCTGSMQKWIDQAKNKLMGIIAQAKADVANLHLRVAFIGYRDFGDKVRFEGPYDFCEEKELPGLLAKLRDIKAFGGDDIPEDVAGGLEQATKLSWKSAIRLCILIADAPCHGQMYHGSMRDRYPDGCPSGLDPSALMYTLQYELGVDFYFVSILKHQTDIMIDTLRDQLQALCAKNSNKSGEALAGSELIESKSGEALVGSELIEPKYVVHDLGSNDNRFLEAVVNSVKQSLNLRIETYS